MKEAIKQTKSAQQLPNLQKLNTSMKKEEESGVKKETPEQSLNKMQKGYLVINRFNNLDSCIVLTGATRVGKTTILNLLAQQTLEASLNSFNRECFIVKNQSQNIYGCRIGNIEDKSETKIPNIVELTVGNEKIYVVDLPGFMDSEGCMESLSNRFYIRSVFEKMRRIKFVFVTMMNDLTFMKDRFLESIKQFFGLFNNCEKVISQMISSTCLYVTHVKPNFVINERLKSGQNNKLRKIEKEMYNKLVDYWINEDKIFILEEAVIGKTVKKSNLIETMNTSITNWWTREKIGDQISMKEINLGLFDISEEAKLKEFEAQGNQFCNYMEKFFKDNLLKTLSLTLLKSLSVEINEFEETKNIQSIVNFIQSEKPGANSESKFYNTVMNNKLNLLINKEQSWMSCLSLKSYRLQSSILQIYIIFREVAVTNAEFTSIELFEKFKKVIMILISMATNDKQNLQSFKKALFNIYSKIEILLTIDINNSNSSSPLKISSLQAFHEKFQVKLKEFFFWSPKTPALIRNFLNHFLKLKEQEGSYSLEIIKGLAGFVNKMLNYLATVKPNEMMDQMNISQEQFHNFKINSNLKIIKLRFKTIGRMIYRTGFDQVEEIKNYLRQMEKCRENLKEIKSMKQQVKRIHIIMLYEIADYLKKKNPFLALQIYEKMNDAYEILEIRNEAERGLMLSQLNQERKKLAWQKVMKTAQKAFIFDRKQLLKEKCQLARSIAQRLGTTQILEATTKWFIFFEAQNNFLAKNNSEIMDPETEGSSNSNKSKEQNKIISKKRMYQFEMETGTIQVNFSKNKMEAIIENLGKKFEYIDMPEE